MSTGMPAGSSPPCVCCGRYYCCSCVKSVFIGPTKEPLDAYHEGSYGGWYPPQEKELSPEMRAEIKALFYELFKECGFPGLEE